MLALLHGFKSCAAEGGVVSFKYGTARRKRQSRRQQAPGMLRVLFSDFWLIICRHLVDRCTCLTGFYVCCVYGAGK